MKPKILCALLLFLSPLTSFGADQVITAKGNIIFETGGDYVRIEKPVRVNFLKNFDGTGPAPGGVPIGGVVAVVPNLHANLWQPPSSGAIKDGFMRADGNTIPSCSDCKIPSGTTLPNMVGRYVKGNSTSGTLTGASSRQLISNNIPALSKAATLGGQVDGSGNATTHTHSYDHSHTSNDVTTSHTHSHAHTHTIGLDLDAGHGHSFTSSPFAGSTSNHAHASVEGPTGHGLARWTPGSQPVTFAFNPTMASNATYNGPWVAWYSGGHNHTFSTNGASINHNHGTTLTNTGAFSTGDISASHSHTVASFTSPTDNQSSTHTHTYNAGAITMGNVSPTAITLQPAYVQVVWVIRVK